MSTGAEPSGGGCRSKWRASLTKGKRNWGYAFRFGLVEIDAADFRLIAEAMAAIWPGDTVTA